MAGVTNQFEGTHSLSLPEQVPFGRLDIEMGIGFRMCFSGRAFTVADNDEIDDATGKTFFLRLGRIDKLLSDDYTLGDRRTCIETIVHPLGFWPACFVELAHIMLSVMIKDHIKGVANAGAGTYLRQAVPGCTFTLQH